MSQEWVLAFLIAIGGSAAIAFILAGTSTLLNWLYFRRKK